MEEEMEVGNQIEKYLQFFEDLKSKYVEREWELEQIKYALLIKEHVLLLGGPGLAKSQMAKEILNALEGAKIYTNQFSADQDPSYIFGPQSLNEFKKGIIKHNTEGSLVDADYAFLDEFFNASTETINASLEILNERTFTRLHQKECSPLCTAIITTNRDRSNEEELAAVYDRILFVSEVQPIRDKNNRLSMYKEFLAPQRKNVKFSMADMSVLYSEFTQKFITIEENVIEFYDEFLIEFVRQTGIYISDRKKNKLLYLVCASAFLSSDRIVTEEDLLVLKLALVRGGDHKTSATFDLVYSNIKIQIEQYKKIKEYDIIFQKLSNFEGPKGDKLTETARRGPLLGLKSLLQDTEFKKAFSNVSGIDDLINQIEALLAVPMQQEILKGDPI